VGAADVHDDLAGEALAHPGAAAGGVELFGGLGVGVIVEQPVEHREGAGVGLAGLPGVQRDRDREGGRLAAAEADVQVDLVGLVHRGQVAVDPKARVIVAVQAEPRLAAKLMLDHRHPGTVRRTSPDPA